MRYTAKSWMIINRPLSPSEASLLEQGGCMISRSDNPPWYDQQVHEIVITRTMEQELLLLGMGVCDDGDWIHEPNC